MCVILFNVRINVWRGAGNINRRSKPNQTQNKAASDDLRQSCITNGKKEIWYLFMKNYIVVKASLYLVKVAAANFCLPFAYFTHILALLFISYVFHARDLALFIFGAVCLFWRKFVTLFWCEAIGDISWFKLRGLCVRYNILAALHHSGLLLYLDGISEHRIIHISTFQQTVDKMGFDQSYFKPFRIFHILDGETSKCPMSFN